MDDDLPKEGELLDISKNKNNTKSGSSLINTESSPTKSPIGIIVTLVVLAVIAFIAQGSLGGNESPEKIVSYQQDTQSIFSSMKSQFPYLESIVCEGSDPRKEDCVNFVGTFRPNKESPQYLASMGVNDKVEGATSADISLIKDHVKVLVGAKRMNLPSVRKPFTFLVSSVTIPSVGAEIVLTTRCSEGDGDTVICTYER